MNQHEFTHKENQESQAATRQTSQSQTEREFANVEELLRYDASQNPAPPEIARRLERSLENEPPPPVAPWWKRLLGS